MNQATTDNPSRAGIAGFGERSRALRHACRMHALSRVPTVLGLAGGRGE